MKRIITLTALMLLVGNGTLYAGVKLTISDETNVDLGFRLQTQFLHTDNRDGTTGESYQDFNIRRARVRLGGDVTRWVSFFLQTEAASASGSGLDMRVIDAWVSLNLHPLAKLYLGEHMAPAARQIVTSSGGLMAIDRPNINSYNLTWGLNGRTHFNTANFANGDLDLSGEVNVRDEGATVFGAHSFNDITHIKYYLGVYDGIQASGEDKERYTARVQVNFLDAEEGYYNLSTYLGEKKTIGLGGSYDIQKSIATDIIEGEVDYKWWALDAFVDWPAGPGVVTFEAGYNNLDLDGAAALITDAVDPADARITEGDGWYVQAGYLFKAWNLQPWVLYEEWKSEAPGDTGSFYDYRIGLSYFFKGHNANVKLGYEHFESDAPIGTSAEDSIETVLLGFYVTY